MHKPTIILYLLLAGALLGIPSCTHAGRSSSESPSAEPFRMALSLSPFSLGQFAQGYTFELGETIASTPEELQQLYCALGATEMYARIATKRYVTKWYDEGGDVDAGVDYHTLEQGLMLCSIAARLHIPINPEIMCAYTYMDMMEQQAPCFDEYPEIVGLQHGKAWEELTLEEICLVLEAYGAFVGESILSTGCEVRNWNLGNEANYGFAGISMGLRTAVNPELETVPQWKMFSAPMLQVGWLEESLWQYEARAMGALKKGILSAYDQLGIDATQVRFSTHIATVVATPKSAAAFFRTLQHNGFALDVAGISYYPSAPGMVHNKKKLLKRTIDQINQQCGLPVFIAEYAYPSGPMEGPYAGWNKQLGDYTHTPEGQSLLFQDLIAWGKHHGLEGIRYWAPDFEGWFAMAAFDFSDKHGVAKPILTDQSHRP